MNITHLNLVAVMRNGVRYPIASVRVPAQLTPKPGFELPLELIMLTATAQHAPHKVEVDARPWLLFAGTDQQAANWQSSNHMTSERFRRVWSSKDVRGIQLKDWQPCAIGTWHRNPQVRTAFESLCWQKTAATT